MKDIYSETLKILRSSNGSDTHEEIAKAIVKMVNKEVIEPMMGILVETRDGCECECERDGEVTDSLPFSWKDVPSVYKWFAVDIDGKGFMYESKPIIGGDRWWETANERDEYKYMGIFDSTNWRESLQERK